MSANTLPGLLLERAKATPKGVALRHFRQGKWNEVTYAGLLERVSAIGGGLADLGVKANDVVVVISEDGPTSLSAQLGAQGLGASVLQLDPDASDVDVRASIARAGAVVAIVGDQEQFDKVDEGSAEVPSIRAIVVDTTRGLRYLDDAAGHAEGPVSVLTLAQLSKRGDRGTWERTATTVTGGDTASVSVVGQALARKSHAELIDAANGVARVADMKNSDSLFSLYPLSDGLESALLVAGPLMTGAPAHFGGRGITTRAIQQVQPTLIHATPEWLSQIDADATNEVSNAKYLKKLAVSRGLRPSAPLNAVRPARNAMTEPTRLVGLAGAAAIFVFLLVSVSMHDALRLLICALIALACALVLLFTGHGAVAPLRRRFGLSRCRAVLSSQSFKDSQQQLLGALGVPVVPVHSEVRA